MDGLSGLLGSHAPSSLITGIPLPYQSPVLPSSVAYKQDQKGKRVAAADRRKQKAVAAQTAASEAPAASSSSSSSLSGAPQPTSSGSTGGVVSASAPDDSVGMTGNSSGMEGVESGVPREEEAMETDTVEPGGGAGGTATPLSSVS